MRTMLVGLVVVLVCSANARADADAVKKDMAALEGEWSMVSGERDGGGLDEGRVKSAKRGTKDGGTTGSFGEQGFMKGKYKVDPRKTPKTVGQEVSDGPAQGQR